jgi:hypothetical protein
MIVDNCHSNLKKNDCRFLQAFFGKPRSLNLTAGGTRGCRTKRLSFFSTRVHLFGRDSLPSLLISHSRTSYKYDVKGCFPTVRGP